MFTKGQANIIRSLQDKKYRQNTGLFLVEGEKSVAETLASDFEIKTLLATKPFCSKYQKLIMDKKITYEIVEQGEIENAGSFESNGAALAVVKQKGRMVIDPNSEEIILALDNIRDPGNLGTIIRIADWYGIKKIAASTGTVDLYNPKVISATKGSFTRVGTSYVNLNEFLSKTKLPILGAFLEGENVHKFNFPKYGILIVGNESNGISPDIEKLVTKKVTIPAFGQTREKNGRAESLNVAISTAILIDNWKRNLI